MEGFCTTIKSPDVTNWQKHVMKVLTKIAEGLPKAVEKALVSFFS
jgi:hypothetical protein